VALAYIDRIIVTGAIVLSSLNVHRLLITSIMLAAKFLDDLFYNNAFYAKLGGVSAIEMNTLEIEFLKLINFSLFVSPEVYNQYSNELLRFAVALEQAPPAVPPFPSTSLISNSLQVSTSSDCSFPPNCTNAPSISPISVAGHPHIGYFSTSSQFQSHSQASQPQNLSCHLQPPIPLPQQPQHKGQYPLEPVADQATRVPGGIYSSALVPPPPCTPTTATWGASYFGQPSPHHLQLHHSQEQQQQQQQQHQHQHQHHNMQQSLGLGTGFDHFTRSDRELAYSHRYEQEEQNYSFLVSRPSQYSVPPVGSY